MTFENKSLARRHVRALLKGLPPQRAREAGEAAAQALPGLPDYGRSEIILAFLSMPGEIDTTPLITRALAGEKIVAVPRIDGEELSFVPLERDWEAWSRDRFGIPAPPADAPALSLSRIGGATLLVITPGLAFTPSGKRLGRGKGFYDRFLSRARNAGRAGGGRLITVGFCFSCQVFPDLPTGPLDEPVDYLITERGLSGAAVPTSSEAGGME